MAEKSQQFVHLNCKIILAGHCVQQTVDTVNNDYARPFPFDIRTDSIDKLAGREFRGIDLLHPKPSGGNVWLRVTSKAGSARHQRLNRLVEAVENSMLTPACGLD